MLTRYLGLLILLTGIALPVAAERPNVLLITVDTFRPDRLSAYGHTRNTSPYLDQLAADGVLFEQTVSSSSWTTPGLLSVLTGQWAPTHAVDVRGKSLKPGTPTMATLLREAGYAAPDILYLSSIPNFSNLGLTESYPDRDKYLPDGDAVLFRALEAYRDSTFFLYYHYRNLHLPFLSSPEFDRMYTQKGFDRSPSVRSKVEIVQENVTIPIGTVNFEHSDRAWVLDLYDAQIREMDEQLFKPLIAHLKNLGLYKNTLIIVTADHGEELLERGFIGHPSTSFKGTAYDELIRIPLMMIHPAHLPKNTRIPQQVHQVDILPTVLHLLNLPIPNTVQGRSLLPLIRGEISDERPAFSETTPGGYQATPDMMKTRLRTMRTSEWKLIHTHGPGVDRYELYHLKTDPQERRNIVETHPEIFADMRTALHRWVLESQPATAPLAEASGAMPTEAIHVLFPKDGDAFRYEDVGKTVSVRWTGPEDALYTLEYRVGEGNYHLTGTMQVRGNAPQYGPFTDEMWNMLALYNPFAFRILVDGKPELSSPWVQFTVVPTADAKPPSWWTPVKLATLFWWGEAALLFGGLGLGLLDLLRWMGNIALIDIISAALLLAIAIGVARAPLARLGAARIKHWGIAALWVGLIFSTLSILPSVWRALWVHTQGRIDYIGTLATASAVLGMAAFLVISCRRVWPFLGLIALASVYGWLLINLSTSPAERLHLLEYGLLGFLIFRALLLDASTGRAYILAWIIATLIGLGDEGVQWILPTRVFEWADVALNAASSGLGLVAVALLRAGRS